VYPVTLTIRHSNVYEERSLGIYADDPGVAADTEAAEHFSPPARPLSRRLTDSIAGGDRGKGKGRGKIQRAIHRTLLPWDGVGVQPTGRGDESRISFISQQIHGQLAHDLWLLVLAVLVITTIETSNFLGDPVAYSVFNVVFEVVSAYGCVGISVGLPTDAFSFCGGWHTASKLVLCLVMLRGRHRGLPVALDRAVRLPGEHLHREEEEDNRIRRSMTVGRISTEG
jgi:hypothetical protein